MESIPCFGLRGDGGEDEDEGALKNLYLQTKAPSIVRATLEPALGLGRGRMPNLWLVKPLPFSMQKRLSVYSSAL